MHFTQCEVADAWVIDPAAHEDARGRFFRAWCRDEFAAHGVDFTPLQANMAHSVHKGTIRGLHYQVAPALEAKLVRCTAGSIFDVVVDIRMRSPAYGRHIATVLSAEDWNQIFIPAGFNTVAICRP